MATPLPTSISSQATHFSLERTKMDICAASRCGSKCGHGEQVAEPQLVQFGFLGQARHSLNDGSLPLLPMNPTVTRRRGRVVPVLCRIERG